jgi:hypothetical protein
MMVMAVILFMGKVSGRAAAFVTAREIRLRRLSPLIHSQISVNPPRVPKIRKTAEVYEPQAEAGGALSHLNHEIVASLDDFQDPSQEWRRLFSELLGTP